MDERNLYDLADKIALINAAKPADDNLIFGTVMAVDIKYITVRIDGAATQCQVIRACNPSIGNRVLIVKKNTLWLAMAVIAGDDYSPNRNPSSGWVWTKYANGRAIAHRLYSFSGINITNAWGAAGYYANAVSFGSFPSGIFMSTPAMFTQTHSTSVAGCNSYGMTSSSAGTGEIYSFRSYTGVTVPISYLAVGNWK